MVGCGPRCADVHGYLDSRTFHERGALGNIFKAIFGYNGNPSLLELITYVVLLAGATVMFRAVSSKR